MTEFKTADELAGFLYCTVMPSYKAMARYIEDYAEYYHNMKMIEMVSDIKLAHDEARSVNKKKRNEKDDAANYNHSTKCGAINGTTRDIPGSGSTYSTTGGR